MRQARGMPQYHFRAIMFFNVKLLVIIIQRATMSAGNPNPMGPFVRKAKPHAMYAGMYSLRRKDIRATVSAKTRVVSVTALLFSNQFSCKKIQVRSGTGTDYGRGKSGGKSRNAENRKGNRVKPVKKRRLIIPVFPVNTGGKPVACEKHFFCRFTVDRFVRIYERNDVRK